MGSLKYIYNQIFTAGRLTKKFCGDPIFVQRIGFVGVPAPEHVLRLKRLIQFVLAMYDNAKAIFEKHTAIETDAKLCLLMISRFRVITGIRYPEEQAVKCLEELKLAPRWMEFDVKEKFFDVCRCVFAEEMKADVKNGFYAVADPFFAKDEVIELISLPIVSEVLNSIFEEVPWEIRENQISFSGEREWKRFPSSFARGLREVLSTENFQSLTVLAEKYRLFEQPLFAHPEVFEDIHNEMTYVEITGILTSMGNELYKRNLFEDAEKVLRIVLQLQPENFAASGILAVICHFSERHSEARELALRSLADEDRFEERYKGVPSPPPDIVDPNAVDSFNAILRSIAEGKTD